MRSPLLVSAAMREIAQRVTDVRFGGSRETQLKGLAGNYALHAVAWAA